MRLSEDRINAIAHKIAFELVKKRYVQTTRAAQPGHGLGREADAR